ncbi:putative patatin-like phospholipase domain LELG-00944 protein [Gregarina niphandrodes]|uniref:Patatin-like phospholipase domain LELG-00944 protein n=1 Tax=Gregarina niphandrodes TaxID=110365 RepID=A0A023BAH4_GRENI|nr:putative patatin-like phospholipase domain LELG-00944 protein [Gregarina niphandrodes]EZG78264.1 putative patatin-like phospholipase domain LELG-00944 protein [Gregarina niphandrodes]|eukprot:XP_011129369.1 putative patatin-like phospholipase domain LELG-00944 protein [Gregarina niphandrodes]
MLTSITEYAAVASELDRKLGLDLWKKDVKSHGYDFHRVQLWSKALSVYLESNALDRLCEVLLQSQKSNHGGTLSTAVYSYTYWNTKDCIIQYHRQLIK